VGEGSGKKFHAVAGSRNSAVHEGVEALNAVGTHAGIFDAPRHELFQAFPGAVDGLALVADPCVGRKMVDLSLQAQKVCALALDLLVHSVVESAAEAVHIGVVAAQVEDGKFRSG
jgi:hypothetical protein